MIKILLDSSTTKLSVGIAQNNQIIDSLFYDAWQKQSEKMIPELLSLLKKNNFSKEDIECVIVGIGPGSYTGVRIAVTIAKIIGVALNVKIYPVSSLGILKHDEKKSICLINARSGRSYAGFYENNKAIVEDSILSNDEVLSFIKNNPDVAICGETSYLGIAGEENNVFVAMLSLAKKSYDAIEVNPIYLKD